jgi:hypothetical protein
MTNKFILDKNWFKQNVLPDIDQYLSDGGHKTDCKKNDREYRLKGFRPNPRTPILQVWVEIGFCIYL